jgi:hypothetical protein
MSCIELLADLGVMSVRLAGPVEARHRAAMFDELLDLQGRTSCRRVLVDMTDAVIVDGSSVEAIEHAARLARHPVMRGLRVAYVGEARSASSIESLAALRGYFYQRFRTRAAALRWLCGNAALAGAA